MKKFSLALPGGLKHTNTKDDKTAMTSISQTVHFDWYNCYSTDVGLFYIHYNFINIFYI
jgi:hypothetical protein